MVRSKGYEEITIHSIHQAYIRSLLYAEFRIQYHGNGTDANKSYKSTIEHSQLQQAI